jgi:general nucleoside transport system ATP-binding protein
MTMDGNTTAVVEMVGISKRFGDTVANDQVDFDLGPGEVHVLLGENGAGKTTLMNILFGHLSPDSGEIRIGGEVATFGSPHDAIERGIGMVHQHFSLVPSFTAAENVVLGWKPTTDLAFRSASVERVVTDRARQLGIDIDPAARVRQLPVEMQQRVEIVKALFRGAGTLIMDEPTSLLGPAQIENLLAVLDRLRAQGTSIVLVTHKLAEVMELADRVTVLRRGRKVESLERGHFDERSLAKAMTGHDLTRLPERAAVVARSAGPALEVRDLSIRESRGEGSAVDGLSFSLAPGEILGVAGVEGNGQRQLVDALCGLITPDSGSVEIDGIDVTAAGPGERRNAGLGVVPEDRHLMGLVLDMTLAENVALNDLAAGRKTNRGMIRWPGIRDGARRLLEEYDVRPPDPGITAASLSGGNQQKVVLARELSAGPSVLIADNPTWGLDVGAIQYVHARLLELRQDGGAILLVTLDLDELFRLADRLFVLYRGRKVLEGDAGSFDTEALGVAMAGGSGRA